MSGMKQQRRNIGISTTHNDIVIKKAFNGKIKYYISIRLIILNLTFIKMYKLN